MKQKNKIDFNTIKLRTLENLINDWEFVHIETYGRPHCDSLNCFENYVLAKDIYNRRTFIKESKTEKLFYQSLIKYQIEKTIIEDGKLKQYILTPNKKIKKGSNIILKNDILGHQSRYVVESVVLKDIKENMLKVVFKNINKK